MNKEQDQGWQEAEEEEAAGGTGRAGGPRLWTSNTEEKKEKRQAGSGPSERPHGWGHRHEWQQ